MKKTCEFCNGIGQISFFKGVSRFLLSSEDCPECAGLGFIVSEKNEGPEETGRELKQTQTNKKN